MKVVFVAPNLGIGGVERQWSVLVPALVERGVTAEVVTLDGKGRFFDELVRRGVRAECVGLGRFPVAGMTRAAAAVAARRPDLVVTQGASAHVVGRLGSRRARVPQVAAIHSIPEHPMTKRQRILYRLVAPRVDACIVVTEAQLPFARSLGFRRSATWVIPTGTDLAEDPPTSDVRADLGIPADRFIALLVASLRPEKRVDRFIEAVRLANASNPSVCGVVVGHGPDLDEVRGLCERSDSVVRALGEVPNVGPLLQASDVVCLTSDAEALPSSLLEAMALGRPVVATEVGGVPEAVVDGITGYLVAPGDVTGFAAALGRLAGDRALAARLGEEGRRRQRELFTTERMVDAHLAFFEELAENREPSRLRSREQAMES